MRYDVIDGISWPVAEQADFESSTGGEGFPFFEEEGGELFGFGHVPPDEFIADVKRFLDLVIPSGDFDEPYAEDVRHVWAKYIDKHGERFDYAAAADTPHAFPMTVWGA